MGVRALSTERKSIFITGASCGMGRATARLFARKGWFVGIYDVDEQGLEALEAELGAEQCHRSRLDVSDRAAFQAVLDEFEDRSAGQLDLLFNNAGIIKADLFGNMDFAEIERIIQVNLMGVLYGIHAAYPLLARTPNSLCFTTSSSSAIFGAAGLAAYTASKNALKGLTESLSVEFSIIDSRAADAQPGHIETGMTTEEFAKELPKQGPWRLVPAEAVADVVWASYHDTSGRLHWYVPDDLEDYRKRISLDMEAERDARIRGFKAAVKRALG